MLNMKYEEIEVKFTDIDVDTIKSLLIESGATIQTQRRLMKRVVFGAESNPGLLCTYARVRDEGSHVTMSAKFISTDGSISSQKEICLTVDNFDHAKDFLDAMGLHMTNFQESYRETWKTENNCLVEIEEWPQLPSYLEIEGSTEDSLQTVANELKLSWSDHMVVSTDQLYAKHFNISGEKLNNLMSNLQFDNI